MMAYPCNSSPASESRICKIAGESGRNELVSSFMTRLSLYRNPSQLSIQVKARCSSPASISFRFPTSASVFSSQFSALSFQLSVFSSQFSALSFQLSVFSSQFSRSQLSAFRFQIQVSDFKFQISAFGFQIQV